MAKKSKEIWKVYNNVFDNFTILTLEKLRGQHHFDELISPVSIGKESNVFTASKGGEKVIVKIYRLESADFNRMYEYIRTDPRFKGLKAQRRKVIFAWAQREYKNLLTARNGEVACPLPYAVVNNVLIEELIGQDAPAPKLKNQTPKNPAKFFDAMVREIAKLKKIGLVHADLSPFNVLNDNEHPILIDFSTATPFADPNGKEYWTRDLKNISTLFEKQGVDTIKVLKKHKLVN
ncbi:serine protein kinase RIO [Candidatus Woesearchaeota archaeon]|nr:MAG: RIO kinase 1 [archaeon GW2011_AR4]MBS3129042.1 serine protein kinase RIO [Candidatus Woesearchaeota archaeon]HIH37776.1 serine protein kinase RIO [Candidatus Woesearchaeota archaeon]HIH49541.1 serine protein kinase RIO [Candidatus Woesearchaeota archaeon]HIJ03901.1 serine protein kinase RIO [Candidatus Woesearchaeota archaeon]